MSYVVRVLIAIDQLGNALFGGNPDETISSRVGRGAIDNKKWALIAEKVINALFWFDPDHCRKRVEWEEIRSLGTALADILVPGTAPTHTA